MHSVSIYSTEMYVNVCRDVFRILQIIYGGAFLRKSQKNFIVNVRLGSKYASGISFLVEKVCRMSILNLYSQSQLCQSQKFATDLLVSGINKKHIGLTKKMQLVLQDIMSSRRSQDTVLPIEQYTSRFHLMTFSYAFFSKHSLLGITFKKSSAVWKQFYKLSVAGTEKKRIA